jgi:hypothetical protein
MAAFIPETAEPPRYFLQEINNPFWHWVFRAVFLCGFLGFLLIVAYYSRRSSSPGARKQSAPKHLRAERRDG